MNDAEHNPDEPLTFAEACRDEEIAKRDTRIAELERELSKHRGPAINPPCPACPSGTPDQVIFSPVYGGNRHFYCKSCEQSFAGSFTYGPSELERRVEDWREYYIAGVLLDELNLDHPAHSDAVQRIIKAFERLSPVGDETLSRELDEARKWAERETNKRESELSQLRAQVENAKAALGEHPDSEVDLAQRIIELRDQARKPFHESTASMQEKDRLRAQVETLTRERDEARAERDTVVECFEAVKKLHGHACNQWAESIAQRQDFRAQVETLTKERDEARAEASRAWGINTSQTVQIALMSNVRQELEAQLAASEADRERLDWLLKLIEDKGTDGIRDLDWTVRLDPITEEPETWLFDRAAIDAAREEEA